MKKNIREAARIIRSKNSGPYELTLDIMFKERRYFDLFRTRKIIDAALIERLYCVPAEDILGILYFEPALAVKITMKRRMPSGGVGDGDIYGAQQHAPLLDIEFDEE
jgi:hypothetical protein